MMKKYFILAALLCFSNILIFSQDIIDPPKLSQFNTTTVVSRDNNKFIIGWNWGTPGAMLDSAMFINTYHGFDYKSDDYLEDTYVMVPPVTWDSYIVGGRNKNYIFNAHCLYLDPSLLVDTTQGFAPRANENTGAVMGFLVKDTIVSDDSIASNGNGYLVLKKDLLSDDSAKVLSNIWKNGCLRWLDYDGGDMGGDERYRTNAPTEFFNDSLDRAIYHVFNGKLWYISINLRALNLNEIQNNLDSTILIIKMPYTLKKLSPLTYTQGYTKFNLLPRDSIANVDSIIGSRNDYRGAYRQLDTSVNKPTEFIIKGSMLQTTDENTRQITISALAFFDGIPHLGGYRNNPCFKNDWYQNLYNLQEYISQIDVEVYYYGNLDVAIDWVKIETPRSQQIFRGFYDINVSKAVDSLFDFVGSHSKHLKINRIYANDELIPSQWAANRYFNMLVDTLAAVECYPHQDNTPSHFLHATGFKEYWSGSSINFFTYNAVPFIKKSISGFNPRTFNYSFGYAGYNGLDFDTLNSQYETYLYGTYTTLPLPDSIYNTEANDSYSTQFHIENIIHDYYYKNPTLFYSSKPWWANLWVQADGLKYYKSDIQTFTVENWGSRPKTGEEIRLIATLPVLLGAKGLMYWQKNTNEKWQENAGNSFIGLQPFEYNYGGLSGEDLLKSDIIGGDYIKFPNDANGLHNSYRQNYFDFNTMGIDSNHIYIGLASTRLAVARVNEWVSRCEDELMKLRLVSWYGKGYLTLKHHHPDYPDDVFKYFLAWDTTNNMIDTNRFKTWPIGRYHIYFVDDPSGWIGGTPVIELLTESWDSTFVDITLLRNVDNGVYYISVLNRRTDPLVKINNNYQFFSTAEFEDSCDAVKNPDNYSTYRDLFYRRNGCRYVFLPFNYQNPGDSTEYALLRITELGADSTYDSTWSYGRKMAFSTKIDTVIGQDRTLAIPFLPGEGKIFKVQVLHPDKNVYGYLYHSNQSKLVAYPDLDSNGNETSAYRYYLTYDNQKIPDSLGRTAVYFRRSKPVIKNSIDENIVWEQELLVSDSVLIDSNDVVARPCDYPSIVVRKDTNGVLKAYIVYSCYKKNDKSMIAETTLDLVNLDYNQKPIGIEISEYSGLERYSWGNPVINASSNGNYYAWSDTTAGIVAAWKSPNDLYFNNPNSKISFKYNADLGNEINALHPSLNVYSHLDSLEDNCSLVWEEHSNPTSVYIQDILYTRLKYNNSMLTKYKANTYLGDSTIFSIRNNIAKLSINDSNVISRRFPVVSRNLGLYVKNPPYLHANRQDIVYWQNNFNATDSACTYLMNCSVDLYDSNNQAKKWRIYYPRYIKSAYRKVSLPNITQGYSLININGYEAVGNSTTLNFWYGLYTPPRIADLGSYIGHLNVDNHSYVYSLYDSSYDAEDKWVRLIGNGYIPHLAKHKNFSNTLWQNRRVYQFHNISVAETQILTSAKYFYKGRSDEMLADWYIGFETADSSKKSFLFGAPELDEQRFSLKLPFEKVVSDEGFISFIETSSDTIASSWFSIEDAKELALKLKGSNHSNSKVYIQNKETERTLRLNLPNVLKENKGAKAKYNLINGLGNEFRLLFVKNDEAMQYTEELWIEGLPIEEKPAGSFKGDDGIENIDLIQIVNRYYSDHNISIFPNPASEVLYLQANVPFEEANLAVTNLLGTKVIQQQINLSNSPEIKLDISFLLPGIYYVNISDGLSSISGKFLKR